MDEKLSYYDNNPTVWDSVIRVLKYSESNTVSGFEGVKKFFTWLAGLPPVKVEVLNVFGEGDKVAVEWALIGGKGARKFEIPCTNLYDSENGKIKNVRMQFDSTYFAEIVKSKICISTVKIGSAPKAVAKGIGIPYLVGKRINKKEDMPMEKGCHTEGKNRPCQS